MRHRARTISPHEERGLARTMAAYVVVRGEEAADRRRTEIAALPVKDWNGTSVYLVRCQGPFGRGPHDVWIPERVLWALVDVGHFFCPFHR